MLLACIFATGLTSCTDRQMQGTMVGGTLGAVFGSSIGGLMNGPRGSDAGTAIGMAVGAVVGNAVTAPRDGNKNGRDDRQQRDDVYGDYDNEAPQSYGNGQRYAEEEKVEGLSIKNIRFIDENGNQMLEKGEKAKILFEIHNTSDYTHFNVAPVVSCNDPKRIIVSPTAIIANLEPGKAVTYTANILVTQKPHDDEAAFTLAIQEGAKRSVFKQFTLRTSSGK